MVNPHLHHHAHDRGLILWWPQNKKAFRVNTWFRWKSDTKWKRKNYDLHNIVGFYSMFLVIFIDLKRLIWAFTWFDNSVQWIANGGKTIEEESIEVVSTLAPALDAHPLRYRASQLKNPSQRGEGLLYRPTTRF